MPLSHPTLFQALSALLPESDRPLLARLWEHVDRRPLTLRRSRPHETLAVSVTGAGCELRCAHCNGHYLEAMRPITALDAKDFAKFRSFLVSGGSDGTGRVPLSGHIDTLLRMPPEIGLNLHVGVQGAEALLPLSGRPVTISYDLAGDTATLREVYGLDRAVSDIESYYIELSRHFRVIPHVTLGLRGGRLSGESHVIEFLAGHVPDALTFLVFRPTPGTPYEGKSAPDIPETVGIIAQASERLPCPLHLGCMRPTGIYRRRLDILAWAAGARVIVMPEHEFVRILAEHGIPIEEQSECCSLGHPR
ncbi:MAG TPA: radical SAM protein [Candidatus Ozemobacteraceae bacterium]|nr:radical SAM protein [Candidatus Ozemobacteraceae bacterium]